ncbi:MAG: hypothetical protein Q8P90_00740 [bacterium]|nr:hypothetical protein [bacterium]
MDEANKNKSTYWILGAALLLIGVFVAVALVMVNSQAVGVSTQVSIGNQPPTVSSHVCRTGNDTNYTTSNCPNPLQLTDGLTTKYSFQGIVTDPNGASDITGVKESVRRTALGGGCTPDNNDCYIVDPCTWDTGYGTTDQASFKCSINMDFYADSTESGGVYPADTWTATVVVSDDGGSTYVSNAINTSVETHFAVQILSTPVEWGARPLGFASDTGNNISRGVKQAGNDQALINISGGDLGCSTYGTIPRTNQEYSTTNVAFGSGNAMPASATASGATLDYRTAGDVLDDIWFMIKVPNVGVEGNCTGTITLVAAPS